VAAADAAAAALLAELALEESAAAAKGKKGKKKRATAPVAKVCAPMTEASAEASTAAPMTEASAASAATGAPVVEVSAAAASAPVAEADLCVVCMDARKCVALVPCGHVCLCAGCAASFAPGAACPMCRCAVRERYKVFF
jgi:hypothetical protein